MSLTQQQKIAIVLMNLPAAETAMVWNELTSEERSLYCRLYAELPALGGDLCEQLMDEFLKA